jgi:transcriptional regulator with XRE-family HTH domain
MELGEKIKALRIQKKLSLNELSRKSGVSKSLQSQIERNISVPTVTTLRRITTALEISVSDFFTSTEIDSTNSFEYNQNTCRKRIAVVAKNERKRLTMPKGKIQYELLSPDLQHKIQFVFIRLPPGAKTEAFLSHEGEECGVVLKGRLKGEIGKEVVILNEGDSICYDGTIPHRWENIGRTKALSIWAVTPPSL